MDPSNSAATAGPSSGMKRRGRPLGSGKKTKAPAQWTPGAGGPLRIGAPRQGEESRAAAGTSGALTLRGPARGGALNSPSPLAAAPAPRASGSIDRALREVEAALGPPPADLPLPPVNGVVATPRHLAAAMLGPLIAPGSRFLELLVVVDPQGFNALRLPDAIRRVFHAHGPGVGEIALGEQSRPDHFWPVDILFGATGNVVLAGRWRPFALGCRLRIGDRLVFRFKLGTLEATVRIFTADGVRRTYPQLPAQ